MYDPDAKKDRQTVAIKAKDVKGDGYFLYDLFDWEPKGNEFLWISPGIFDMKKQKSNPSYSELLFNGIEMSQTATVPAR